MSLGFGFRINLPKDIALRLAWGFPVMRNNHEEVNKCGRFHIEMSVSPDFDALVNLRKPKNGKKVEKVKIDDGIKFTQRNKTEQEIANKKTVIKKYTTVEQAKNKKRIAKIAKTNKLL
jgi:hypothetical protein